jgi:hypothetical protein
MKALYKLSNDFIFKFDWLISKKDYIFFVIDLVINIIIKFDSVLLMGGQ